MRETKAASFFARAIAIWKTIIATADYTKNAVKERKKEVSSSAELDLRNFLKKVP